MKIPKKKKRKSNIPSEEICKGLFIFSPPVKNPLFGLFVSPIGRDIDMELFCLSDEFPPSLACKPVSKKRSLSFDPEDAYASRKSYLSRFSDIVLLSANLFADL